MNSLNHRYILSPLLALPLLMAPAVAMGQLHESVQVDGTYLRDVLHPDRINRLPRLTHFALGETPLDYATAGVKADFTPMAPVIPATAWGASRQGLPTLGYLDLEAGSYLNSSLSFGIGLLRQPEQRLDLRLQHNSTSLWHPYGDLTGARISYAECLGLSYARRFRDMGIFTASAQYHLGYFNYYGIDPEIIGYQPLSYPSASSDRTAPPAWDGGSRYFAPTQTLNDAALRLGWSSDPEGEWPVDWHAGAGLRHFAYRTATRETEISLEGGLSAKLPGYSRVGVDADLRFLCYGEGEHPVPGTEALAAPDSYSALSISPYYKWQKNNLSLLVGADVDLTFNADGYTPDTHYGALHASPDIRFDVAARNVGFYVHLTGGTELHTLAAMSQLDPYRNPHLESTRPVHTPFDANIGVNLTPFRGFSAEVNVQYKSTSGVPLGGWYMAMLNYGATAMPGLWLPEGVAPVYGTGMERYSLSGLGASLKLAYRPTDFLAIEANGSYTPQHDKTGIFNGLDRPRWVLDAQLELSPVRQLSVGVKYAYRGVRRIFMGYSVADSGPELLPGGATPSGETGPKLELTSMRLPDITDLSAHVRWDVTPKFSLRVEARNLLGQRAEILPMQPSEGVTFAGGLQWLF